MEGLSHWRGDIYWICKWNSQIPKVIKPKQWCIWTSACIGLPAPAFYGTAFIMPIPCFKTYGSFTFAITPKLIHLAFKILTRTLILPFLRSRPSRQVRLVSVSCTISCCNIITWYNNETWCFCLLLPLPAATVCKSDVNWSPSSYSLCPRYMASFPHPHYLSSSIVLRIKWDSLKMRICILTS